MASTGHGPVHDGPNRDPIAIVGIGCRFPGGVDTPRAFWDLLCKGVDAIGPMPADRFDVDAYYHPTPATPGKIVTRDGGWLGGIDEFDAEFFGISAREAIWLDPQQRLLLEVAWEALEDAGMPRQRVAGSRTGVFIGLWTNDYVERAFAASDDVDLYVTTGGGRYSAAGRLSFAFDLRGPSLTVDTACSSSLVAVHLACQSLRSGESELALAGGANLILQPQISIGYSRSGMLSPDARCKFGDADANGYVRSEGIGVLVLKPLAAALAAGDPIYALIRGSAVNSDGRSNGLLVAPSKPGQEAMLREAYRDAELDPALVGYVEAHGTGTRAGDPVEVEALGSVLGNGRPADRPCLIGSVKTNIGHTEAASGVAGLIKAALCLQHRQVPANLHLRKPNPSIAWQDLGFIMPRTLTHWPAGGELGFAGVNSFGVTGTNAHVVLQEAPRGREPQDATPTSEPRAELLVLSAHALAALVDLAERYRAVIEQGPPAAPFSPHDLCFTAAVRRSHHAHRLAVVGRTRDELAAHLGAFARGENSPSVVSGRVDAGAAPRVAFVFPGQGSQWPGMARQLLAHEPAFRAGLERCEQAMRPFVNWSLLERVDADPAETSIHEIDVVQPILFAIQVALAALWRSWGVEPDAVIGHSMGEVAAAHVAGALSLEDAARIICCRSRLLRRTSGRGAMATVELSLDETRAALAGYEERLSVAVSNGPRSTVVSGDPVAVDEVLQRLERNEVFCRRVKVDVASHSPQMDPLCADLHRLLAGVRPSAAAVPIYSTVRGDMADGATLDAEYWGRNLREPVLFWPAVQRLLADEHTAFVELSPHPVLLPAIQQGLQHVGRAGLALPSMRRGEDERAVMLGTLGALYTAGYPLDWNALYPAGGQVVPLPTYPWQRERYWMDTPAVRPSSPRTAAPHEASAVEHPLLGRPLPEVAQLPGTHVWQSRMNGQLRPYLPDCAHLDAPPRVVPERYYHDMALAAASAVYGPHPHTVTELTILQPLSVVEGTARALQFVLTAETSTRASFRVFTRPDDAAAWTEQASGTLRLERAEPEWLYELSWEPKPRESGALTDGPLASGTWWVFVDQTGVGEAVAQRLEAAGATCVRACRGDRCGLTPGHPQRVLLDLAEPEELKRTIVQVMREAGPCQGIVYLWGLDLPDPEGLGDVALEQDALGCDGVVYLAQALIGVGGTQRPRVWVVTRGAQPAGAASAGALAVAQAPLWGVGRTLALEHPDLWGGLIDLALPGEPGDVAVDAALVCAELLSTDGEDQVALQEGQRLVARLRRAPMLQPRGAALACRGDGAYLITGGLGGLGVRIARWLVDQGARHLVLTGRNGLPERAAWDTVPPASALGQRLAAVRELEARGATVSVVAADVADAARMAALFAEFGRTRPALRGVVHAAGVGATVPVAELDAGALRDTLRAKVAGSWVLHQLTAPLQAGEQPLDFLVLFSSGAAVWGSQGLAHYAAANSFLDALAQYRRARGLPALSVNWGWWAGDGIVTAEMARLFRLVGLDAMPAEAALATLGALLTAGAVQRTVAAIDWARFQPLYEASRARPLLQQLVGEASTRSRAPDAALDTAPPTATIRDELLALRPERRRARLESGIREQLAQVLRAAPSRIDVQKSFKTLGLDSLMALEFRSRLETAFGLQLSATLAWNYPTIAVLTPYIARAMDVALESSGAVESLASPSAPRAGSLEPRGSDQRLADLRELSREEVGTLLEEELAAVDELLRES